ncbi:hypothetical protein GC093_04805 [Paenibacillus sp. LMG 31456]|uniref:Uncharacterized protein n=1 Tax=Paenibacillus foliorum TaxID=2654974 RepID=A0A972GXW0_9BACL|nr:hypothetical protein [Paenibacillus foliorum]NOU92551.1 hypothetical protein [Paenibacillus foliorum]
MTRLIPAARLKVKEDTFFLPVQNDGVYFRNNVDTFRMEGDQLEIERASRKKLDEQRYKDKLTAIRIERLNKIKQKKFKYN